VPLDRELIVTGFVADRGFVRTLPAEELGVTCSNDVTRNCAAR
jgi:hypothetical protein